MLIWYLHAERWLEKYYISLLSIIKSLCFYKSIAVSKSNETQDPEIKVWAYTLQVVMAALAWPDACPVQSPHLGSVLRTQALWSQVIPHPWARPETCWIHRVFDFELISGHLSSDTFCCSQCFRTSTLLPYSTGVTIHSLRLRVWWLTQHSEGWCRIVRSLNY